MSPSAHTRSILGFLVTVCALALAHPATAQPVPLPSISSEFGVAGEPLAMSLESVVTELSDRVSDLEQENVELRRSIDNASQIGASDQGQASETSIRFQGRIHVDIWSFPGDSPGVNAFESGSPLITPQDRLELRRARFASEGELPRGTLYKLDFELSDASNPQFRDLYVGWSDMPVFRKLIFGNQKRPYGLDHLNSSNFNVFMERPFVVQAFNRNNRRFGLLSYGVSNDEGWNWRYGVFNQSEIQSDGLYASDHWQLEMSARLARTLFDPCDESRYLHLALSSVYAEPDGVPKPGRAPNEARFRTEPESRTDTPWLDTGTIDGASQYRILGFESVLNLGRLQIAGEYLGLWLARDPAFGDAIYLHGGYIYLAYFLTDNFQPWNRDLGIIGRINSLGPRRTGRWNRGAWQLAARWSFADLSDSDILGGSGESVALVLNWYWTRRSHLQFNCMYGNISDHVPVMGQTFGSYVTIGSRVMVDF